MRFRYPILLACLYLCPQASGQQKDTAIPPKVFTYVEQMPQAGYDYNKYLSEHLRYPDFARNNNIEGRVIVKFVVNEDGMISDASIVRGIGGGCDEEALRVINSSPPWDPGTQNGKPVKVFFTLPIAFKLMEDTTARKAMENKVYTFVQQMPEPGYDWNKYIYDNLQYPDSARFNNVEGRVVAKFIVNEDGSLSDVAILHGLGFGCDEEVLRLLKKAPHWKPGRQNGKALRVNFTMPVVFRLQTLPGEK